MNAPLYIGLVDPLQNDILSEHIWVIGANYSGTAFTDGYSGHVVKPAVPADFCAVYEPDGNKNTVRNKLLHTLNLNLFDI